MGKYLADVQELEETLALANPKVKENVTIETPDTSGQEYLYHLATDVRPRLFPNVSKRAGPAEDNTLPRVCMGGNLMNCWFGYGIAGKTAATTKVDAAGNSSDTTTSNSVYKGGYYIHRVLSRGWLAPNKELVYESTLTEEKWLVTYNELTTTFPTEVIGILFPKTVTFIPRSGKEPVEVATLCLKVNRRQQLHFCADNEFFKPSDKSPAIINEGFYQFDISIQGGIKNFKTITEEEFNNNKLRSAGLLSY